mmetsp:Transcript_28390/g.47981  ORF Transcript_28390/g.47981 Transcript_28390/m.47981 type:complete len:303 (+) Transcript_28390:23-931(+)
MSNFLTYVSSAANGNSNISIDQIFEDFLFHDISDFDNVNADESKGSSDGHVTESSDKKRKQSSSSSDPKKDRREKNKEHAKKSRVRRKFMMESLQQSVKLLKSENAKLKSALSPHVSQDAIEQKTEDTSLIAGDGVDGNCSLDNQDYNLVKALQTAQQNFIVTDPTLPDNPIVFASHGFLALTGYALPEILGRNCRFLQGPETNLEIVSQVSEAVRLGVDHTTVILNYRKDGSTFWNQLFIAALRDEKDNIVNYLGVQCRVSEMYAKSFFKKEQEESEGGQKNTWSSVALPPSTGGSSASKR